MSSTGITPEQQRYQLLVKVKEAFEVDLEKSRIILQTTNQLLAHRQLSGVKIDPNQQMGVVMAEGQIKLMEASLEVTRELLFEAYEKAHGNNAK